MSGIAGLLYHDGRPVEQAELDRMADVLAHRGPDGKDSWREGNIGLAHQMLHTTPESLLEQLPLVSRAGSIVLTADARIDNRERLISDLDLRVGPENSIPDGHLILRAYEKWGEDSAQRLVGDFSFAIWDGRRQQLFCARDHYGVKPFYYYQEAGRTFAFASEVKGLLCLPCVPRRVNETWIADYLEEMFEDREITAYKGIFRLPPAHTLVVRAGEALLRCYWSMDSEREIRYGSDADYEEAFRDIFVETVRCRLRSAFSVGSTLSGGLDSSSITCVARDLMRKSGGSRLTTLSQVYEDTPSCDERSFINAVLKQGSLSPHFIWCDQVSPVEDAGRFLWHLESPTYANNLALFWAVTGKARDHGLRVLLTGLHGDNTLSHGTYYMADLLRSARFVALVGAVRSYARNCKRSAWWSFRTYAAKPLLPPTAWRLYRRLSRRSPHASESVEMINGNFARRIGVEQRRRTMYEGAPRAFRSARQMHGLEVTAGITTSALEAADLIAAAFSTELRHPFLDKRLVEFCLALPSEQKFRSGWPRSIIRRSLGGVLPEEVRWRIGKTATTEWYSRALWSSERSRLEQLARDPTAISSYVDVEALKETYQDYSTRGSSSSARALWKPMMLAAWLQTESDQTRDRTNQGGDLAFQGSTQLTGRTPARA